MGITRMPNGEYVNIDDNATPEAIERIRARYRNRPAPAGAATRTRRQVSPERAEARRRLDALDAAGRDDLPGARYLRGITDSFFRETVGHLDAPLTGAVNAVMAVPQAVRERSLDPIRREYRIGREMSREETDRFAESDPISSGVFGFTGAMANPIGRATGVGAVANRVAPGASRAIAQSAVGRIAARAGESAAGNAARTGFNQAAVAALADGENLSGAVDQGLVAGTIGGAFGLGINGAARIGSAIMDRAPENATRVAYEKMDDLLSRTRRPGNANMPYTPEAVVREMRASTAAGHEPRVMDLSPETQATAGYLARRPGLPAANRLVEAGENRLAGVADRFDNEIVRRVDTPAGNSAYNARTGIEAGRRARGQQDYAQGGAMDTRVQWSDDLENFFKSSPDADRLMQGAYRTAQRFGESLGSLSRLPNGNMQAVPTMRVFDYLKREFDGEIGMAVAAGNRTAAAGLSNHLKQLKQLLAEANPQYADILAAQRDAFQKLESIELGGSMLQRMRTRQGAQQLLADMRAGTINQAELRTGIADALLSMRNAAESPVRMMRRFMRSPDQRAVLEYAMGGPKALNAFDRFMRRELRSMRTDDLLARGKQSATNMFQQHGEELTDSAGTLASNVMRGMAFGGTIGAISGGVRTVDQLRRGIGPAAQEELARILMGNGEDLAKGIGAARKYAERARKASQARGRAAGKFGAYLVPDTSGNGE